MSDLTHKEESDHLDEEILHIHDAVWKGDAGNVLELEGKTLDLLLNRYNVSMYRSGLEIRTAEVCDN